MRTHKISLVILCLFTSACGGVAEYQQSLYQLKQRYNTEADQCSAKIPGMYKSEMEAAKCREKLMYKHYSAFGYHFPEVLQWRIRSEYELADLIDKKKVSKEEAPSIRQKLDAEMAVYEAQTMQALTNQAMQPNPTMTALGAAMLLRSTERNSPQPIQTHCSGNRDDFNCTTWMQ